MPANLTDPLHGVLLLNGTVHFDDVSFTPEGAIASEAEMFLVIENVPQEAVDDVDPDGPLGYEIVEEDSTALPARDVACLQNQLAWGWQRSRHHNIPNCK